MKKCLSIILSLSIFFTLAACTTDDINDNVTNDNSEYTLESIAGWWTKPDSYDGLTILYTFCVDAENEAVTSYDDYGNVYDEYPCWYDDTGFSIDCGELFGCVTYILDGDTLLDEEGTVQYVRCEPISSDAAPFSSEDLAGVWYKNGENDEVSECLIFEENSYQTQQYNTITGNGSWSLSKVETHYGDFSYTGAAVEFEGEGFPPSMMWVLEDGNILYDDFHEEFYIKDGLDHSNWETLCEKYELVRDSWECEEDESSVRFVFFRDVLLNSGSSTESIGRWEMTNGTLYLEYADGSIQECEVTDEIFIDYCGKSFIRRDAW